MEHGDFEFDVCVIHGGLVRYCDHRGSATVWKFASEAPAPSPQPQLVASAQEQQPVATSVAVLDPPRVTTDDSEPPHPAPVPVETLADFITRADANRRLPRRAKVNYYACVRSETFGDDIVPCIDMSRGGLSFKTKHPYPRSSVVHIAVPFAGEAPQAPAIFVAAPASSIWHPSLDPNSFAAASPSCHCVNAVGFLSPGQ